MTGNVTNDHTKMHAMMRGLEGVFLFLDNSERGGDRVALEEEVSDSGTLSELDIDINFPNRKLYTVSYSHVRFPQYF